MEKWSSGNHAFRSANDSVKIHSNGESNAWSNEIIDHDCNLYKYGDFRYVKTFMNTFASRIRKLRVRKKEKNIFLSFSSVPLLRLFFTMWNHFSSWHLTRIQWCSKHTRLPIEQVAKISKTNWFFFSLCKKIHSNKMEFAKEKKKWILTFTANNEWLRCKSGYSFGWRFRQKCHFKLNRNERRKEKNKKKKSRQCQESNSQTSLDQINSFLVPNFKLKFIFKMPFWIYFCFVLLFMLLGFVAFESIDSFELNHISNIQNWMAWKRWLFSQKIKSKRRND